MGAHFDDTSPATLDRTSTTLTADIISCLSPVATSQDDDRSGVLLIVNDEQGSFASVPPWQTFRHRSSFKHLLQHPVRQSLRKRSFIRHGHSSLSACS